jgi:hypothetical protein
MVVHSISPHFFHSGGEFSNTDDDVVSVGAGAEEEVFPQDKKMGNKQEIQSVFLMKKRRYRTWRGYDICQATSLTELHFRYVKRS